MLTACLVCESGAVLDRFKHVLFADNELRAFNGIVTFQAPFAADGECFAVNEERLARALAACGGEQARAVRTPDFLVLKQERLTIRVRKLPSEKVFLEHLPIPKKKDRVNAAGLLAALRRVAPFISVDASRPWSVSALVANGYVWATNNLALVRTPIKLDGTWRLPLPAVQLLLLLEDVDWIARAGARVLVGARDMLFAFPESSSDWPTNLEAFFASFPARLPELDKELVAAAKTIEKFSDRFVTLTEDTVQGKTATLESEYEISIHKGSGTYAASLLSLLLASATHADFSTYPKPVHFKGELLEGVAVGVAPQVAAP